MRTLFGETHACDSQTEIVWNPFEDIVPRSTKEEREVQAREEREKEERKAREERKKQAVKNASLLSFDDVEDEDGSFSGPGKRRGGGIKAAHEVLDDGRLESAKEAEKRAQEEEKEVRAALTTVKALRTRGGRDVDGEVQKDGGEMSWVGKSILRSF